MSEEAPTVPLPRPKRGWAQRIVTAVALLLAVLTLGVVTLDSDIGHRWVADRIAALRPANGLRYSIGRIDGSLFARATLIDFRLRDPKGLVFYAPRAELDWSPLAWLHNRLDITSLVIPQARFLKLPQLLPTGRTGPILPGFDIRIGALRVERLTIGAAITGRARQGRLSGRADVRSGRALVNLAAIVAGSDTLALKLDAAPDRDRFDVDLRARGTANGVLAKASGLRRTIAADIHGDGRWSAWRGRATADAGNVRLADLALGNTSGAFTLTGTVTPSPFTHGKLQRLTAPHVAVDGKATLADRKLTGSLDLRSASLALHTTGALDLAASAYRDVRVQARLLQPAALFPNMTGRAIELRAILDGAFATAAFDYRLTADRVAFDKTGFETVRATGKGHFSKAPVIVPIRLTAARVTGIGDVAGGILRNLSIDGILRVTAKLVTGDDLRLASDKLNGRISLVVDLTNGHYEVGLNGGLSRYLIPGLGLVEVNSNLHVVPGPDGHGTRVIGRGTARMLRLDNAFFRSLAGGLPSLVTNLERTTDGVMHFSNLVLTAPQLRIGGAGIRRRDGTFHFEGQGTQASYGPLTLKLDGKIDRPTLDLVFAQPNQALGLSNVIAHLDPTPTGFAFAAHGGSRLGPFDGEGQILLPKGGGGTISIQQLNVSGTHAKGDLAIVTGGFDGALAVTGGGLSGNLLFHPVGEHQQIEAHLDANAARLADTLTVRRGHLDMVALLDPAGTAIDATATGAGLRRGSLVIGRTAIHATLRGGTGEIRASIAGSRGRAFNIGGVIAVSPDRYALTAQGTVDRKPIQFLAPAVFTREDDGWRLAPAKLAFAGGEADLSGRFTSAASEIDATLAKVPLSILDIGYPGLGLGGEASGKLSYTQSRDAAPTGKINMTLRGLTRSGLVLSSRPVDVGIAGILEPGKAAARAVAASDGKTVGRAQMLLTLPTGGDLATRIAHAPLLAQLRYDGPADTLWRLTGIELFDLSGPVAIGADVGGTLDNPSIKGVVRANGAKLESATTGTVLTNVVATGRFGGSRLVLDTLAADAGKGGRVTGSGSFDLAAANGFGIDLAVQAQNALLINRDDIAATVTGPLTFRSDGAGGVIAGNVKLDKSRYRLGQATATSAVPQLNLREINLPGGGEEDERPRKPWKLAVHAHAANNLLVTGLGLRSEWSADLDIGGAPDNPAITGRADLIQGDYQFSGREFQLERGKIIFSGEVPANPALDIAANADSSGLSATIRVTGPALKPEIAFTSTPALPEDELLSRLLFGTSITNLSAPEALQLASAVAALQNGKGGLDPINAVRRVAGLDRLRILPADPQTGAGTAVAAGKYVTRKLFAEIITDGQGYSATQAEFQVTRWLSILSTISTIGRQSANVRVSKDY